MRGVLRDPSLDAAFKELVLTLPSEGYVAEQLDVVDPQKIHAAREAMKRSLARELRADWEWALEAHQVIGGYSPDPVSSGRRALANLSLMMLCLDAVQRGDREQDLLRRGVDRHGDEGAHEHASSACSSSCR